MGRPHVAARRQWRHNHVGNAAADIVGSDHRVVGGDQIRVEGCAQGVRHGRGGGAGPEHGPAPRRRRRIGQLGPHPVDLEQRVAYRIIRGAQLLGRHRPQHQRVDRGDRPTGMVGDVDGHPLRARAGQPRPDRRRARRVQTDAAEREREAGLVVFEQLGEADGVQHRVEQRRMQTERLRLGPPRGGHRNLGEDVVAGAPHGAKVLERGAVGVIGLGQPCVGAVDVHLGGARRRPANQFPAAGAPCGGRRGREHTVDVLGPRSLGVLGAITGVGRLEAGVDAEGSATVSAGRADDDLDVHPAPLRQRQRRPQGQLVDSRRPDLGRGVRRQLDERGTRQQDRAEDHMVGQPWLCGTRQAAGQHQLIAVGDPHGGAQQRVPGDAEARGGDVGRAGHGLQPVPVPRERVGRQVDPQPARQQRPKIGLDAARDQPAERADGGDRLGSTGAQHGDRRDLVRPLDAVSHHCGHDGIRADLEERRHALGRQRPRAGGEPDRFPRMRHPVLGIADPCGVGDLPGHVRDDRYAWRAERDRRQRLAERVQHRFHQRRVESVADGETLGGPAHRREPRHHVEHGVTITGQDHRRRTVDRADSDRRASAALRQRFGDLGLTRLDGGHDAARGKLAHELSAPQDDPGGVLERPESGDVSGGQLADRMTRDEVGCHSPGLHQAVQRNLDREQGRLRRRGVAQRACGAGEHPVPQGPVRSGPVHQGIVHLRIERRAHLVQRSGEHREGRGQLPAHAHALRTLTGEQHGQPARRRPPSSSGPFATRDRGESGHQLLPMFPDDDRAMLEQRPGERQ